LHWLLANLAGMLVSGVIFISATSFSSSQAIASAGWLIRVALVVVTAAWVTPSIDWGESKVAVAAALLAQGALYLLVVAALTWLLGLVPSLRVMMWRQHE